MKRELPFEKICSVPILIRQISRGKYNKTNGVAFLNLNVMKKSKYIYCSLNEGRMVKTYRSLPCDVLEKMLEIRRQLKPINDTPALKKLEVNKVALDYWSKVFKGERTTKEFLKTQEIKKS